MWTWNNATAITHLSSAHYSHILRHLSTMGIYGWKTEGSCFMLHVFIAAVSLTRHTCLSRPCLFLNRPGDRYFHKCCLMNAVLLCLLKEFACETMQELKVWFNPFNLTQTGPPGNGFFLLLQCCWEVPFYLPSQKNLDGFISNQYLD